MSELEELLEYRTFGKTGLKVSAIGMGTYYDALSVIVARFGFHRNRGVKVSALKKGIELGHKSHRYR